MTALDVFWVGLGGGLGTLLRGWIGLRDARRYKGYLPLGTFLINVSGAFVIGYLLVSVLLGVATSLFKSKRINQYVHVMVGTGIMDGVSTFSSFVFGAVQMMNDPAQVFVSVCYRVASLVAGFVAVALGLIAGAKWPAPRATDTAQ